MLKTMTKKTEVSILPDYGKKKLLDYADSFRDLAKTFTYLPDYQQQCTEQISQEDSVQIEDAKQNREAFFWQKRMLENRELLADHLNEMAEIMRTVAEETVSCSKPSDKVNKQIIQALKQYGVIAEELYILENEDQKMRLCAKMKVIHENFRETAEVASLLSVLLNRRLLPCKNSVTLIKEQEETILFEEEAKYCILSGVARAIKEGETVSGDNYSIIEIENGDIVAVLSDGMGSGEKACKDSEAVVDLLEKFLEAGFSKESTVQMINGALIAGSEKQNMSTLDICNINLNTGQCDFIKVGSTDTYIKRTNGIEAVVSDTLPLGIFQKMDLETKKVKLKDDNYVIMMTDGITEAFSEEGRGALLNFIVRLNLENPKEIANRILQRAIRASKGQIKDDMTVLVIGFWENSIQ